MNATSRSIPIYRNNNSVKRARAEAIIQHDERVADYADFIFCSRLVHGIQKKQYLTHDISLRYENQALIDHIIATRRGETSTPTSASAFYDETRSRRTPGARTPPRGHSDESPQLVPSDFADLCESIDSPNDDIAEPYDMIFEMEL